MDRTSFYEWKRRFQTHGLEGLNDLPPVHQSHPQTTPPEIQERIVQLALRHPTRGCNFLPDQLALEGIRHRRTKVRRPQTNGFVERFHRTVLDEFFRVQLRTTLYERLEALQADLDQWMECDSRERPHQGYRNRGKRPYDTIAEHLQTRSQTGLETVS